ncbi:hypothetical protein Q1695_002578 [Nippostrongylus brasiliensis]|nr:hypothetical protein Q1695_002578 [Nippostrongylus brasiliensis]
MLKAARGFYVDSLSDAVLGSMLEHIVELCCNRNTDFLRNAKDFEKSSFNLSWNALITLNVPDRERRAMEERRLTNLLEMLSDHQRKQKQIVASLHRLMNNLVPHFSTEKPEKELLRFIVDWFKSGEMSLQQYLVWRQLPCNGSICLNDLKTAKWPKSTDTLFTRFKMSLDNIPVADLSPENKQHLSQFLKNLQPSQVCKQELSGLRLKVISKLMFVSKMKTFLESELKEKSSIYEVNLYAEYAIILDCNLENDVWHGINLSMVTNKMVICGECTIDLSGKSLPQTVRGEAKSGSEDGEPGQPGSDGTAGESSGNATIITNELKNREKLKILLNGGSGEGGQHGGDGVNGIHAKASSQEDLLRFMPISIRFLSLEIFSCFSPDSTWTKFFDRSGLDLLNNWIERRYKSPDGREIDVTFVETNAWLTLAFFINKEFLLLIRGGQGSMGSEGGKNGLGGEGGNRGEFTARNMTSGRLFDRIDVTKKEGKNGEDGKCGRAGDPGSNGNDVAVIDKSAALAFVPAPIARNFYGVQGNCKLSYSYENYSSPETAFSGHRRYDMNRSDCYVRIVARDLDRIQATKATEKRQASERRKAVSKQTISEELIMSEYMVECMEEELDMHYNEDNEFKAVVAEEEQEQQQSEDQIATVRVHAEDPTFLKQITRRSKTVDVNELITRIQAPSSRTASLEEQIRLIADVFRVPLEIDDNLSENLDAIERRLQDDQNIISAFQGRRQLSNGMTVRDFIEFAREVPRKLREKKVLSEIAPITLDNISIRNVIDATDMELRDVRAIPLDGFWEESRIPSNEGGKSEVDQFFDQLEYKFASTEFLLALYDIEHYLSEKKAAFEEYRNDAINWCNVEAAKAHLMTFLSKDERNRIAEADRAAEEEYQAQFSRSKEGTTTDPVEVEPQTESKSKWSKFADSVSDMVKKYVKSSSFPQIVALLKEHAKGIAAASEKLVNLLEQDASISERLLLEKASFRQRALPGTTPMSLIHIYFMSQQLLDYNCMLYRYHKKFSAKIFTPRDWYSREDGDTLSSRTEFIENLRTHAMPINHSDLREFMMLHGAKCGAYRQFIADQKRMNVQVFCTSGYSKMRLVESLNASESQLCLIFIDRNGDVTNIGLDVAVRQLHRNLQSRQLNVSLPMIYAPDLTSYFDEKTTVQEWSSAVTVSIGSDFLGLLHHVFEVTGCHMTLCDLQFMMNTVVLMVQHYDIPLASLYSWIVARNGVIEDIWLAARVAAVMKEKAPEFKTLVKDLSAIKDPILRALFGSKLEECELESDSLHSVINMLAHAEERVFELEKIPLKDWIDISKCQTWTSYAPLLKEYGTVGYFFVLLDSLGRSEGEQLREIVDRLSAKGPLMVFEKLISLLAYLIAHHEIELNTSTAASVEKLLKTASTITAEAALEARVSFDDFVSQGHAQKFGNLFLLRNECRQWMWMRETRKMQEWSRVVPQSSRTLKDVIRLCVNANDDDTQQNVRKTAMNEIQTLLQGNGDQGEPMKTLRKFDDVLFEKRKIRLRDTQKVAVLSAVRNPKNLLSQVNTGEGKSYIIVALAVMRIKLGDHETVDIITSSSVLAKRDAEHMSDLYEAFGIKASHNCDEDVEKRKDAYKCGVVYGDITRFERDYLLHHFYKRNVLGSRKRCNVIVDEVDSMLLDNGGNMLYLSHNVPGLEQLESLLVFIHKQIRMPSFSAKDEMEFNSAALRKLVLMDMFGMITKHDIPGLLYDQNTANIGILWRLLLKHDIVDEEGVMNVSSKEKLEEFAKEVLNNCGATLAGRILAMINLVQNRFREICVPGYLKNFVLSHLDEFIENAKKSLFLKHNDEYVVDLDHTGRCSDLHPLITIIDRSTGTDLSSSQWTGGLHQFLQLKHGCRLAPLSLKAVFISNVSYLKGYSKINGFSGTLGSKEESNSLVTIYNTDLMKIPTWKARNFNETPPVLALTKTEWVKKIYDETCDQILAHRSVLIICRSIAEVDEIHDGILSCLDAESHKRRKQLEDAFRAVVVYRREFDEFDFSASGGLRCGQVIISTNLAGRGTDIVLHDELVSSGGLHVIVSFLSENTRIEEQAYGRAARCGQPGSGQIITFVESDSDSNIFQLKQFRDNAEVHRLQSLKFFFDYHIDVEEACLRLFQDHCSGVLSDVCTNSDDDLPTNVQVIYFALLDEWALWLDDKADAIKKCELDRSNQQKAEIIESVRQFLEQHPLPSKGQECELPSWISCPQPIITSALIDISQRKSSRVLEKVERILSEYPEFAAEALYYKGVIAQQQIRTMKTEWIGRVADVDNAPERLIKNDPVKLEEATECFLNARGLLTARIQRKNMLCNIVSMLQQNPSTVKSRGFSVQKDEANAVLETLIGNIDDMLGHTVKPEDVRLEDEAPFLQVRRYREFRRAAIFSPVTLSKHITDEQLNQISRKHCLSVSVLRSALKAISEAEHIEEHMGCKVVSSGLLAEAFSMPSVTGFWDSLRRSGCFLQEKVYIAVKKNHRTLVPALELLEPTILIKTPYQIQLTTEPLEEYELFDVHGNASSILKDDLKNREIQECLEAGTVHVEMVGELNPLVLCSLKQLDQFDYLTEEIIVNELNVRPIEARWILQKFVDNNVLTMRIAEVEAESNNDNDTESVEKEVQERTIYTLNDTPSFEMFPYNMRETLQKLLTKHFSYGYALKALQSSVKESLDNRGIQHRIFLPDKPYADLYNDMLLCGILQHERVTLVLKNVYDPSDGDCIPTEIYGRLEKKSPWILINKCDLASAAGFLRKKGVLPGQEARKIIDGGLRQVAVVTKPNPWIWALGLFLVLGAVAVVLGALFLGPIAFKLALAALAAIGTTLSVLTVMGLNQKMKSVVQAEHVDEFKILRDFHEAAIAEDRKEKAEIKVETKHRRIADDFTECLVKQVQRGCILTQSEESVASVVDLVQECCKNSERVSILREGIEFWFRKHAVALQLSMWKMTLDEGKAQLVKLPKHDPPKILFAFGSLLVSDVNVASRGLNGNSSTKAISTKLDYKEYCQIQRRFVEASGVVDEVAADRTTIRGVLMSALREVVDPIVEDCVKDILQSAINRVNSVRAERRDRAAGKFQMSEESAKWKKLAYEKEKSNRNTSFNFLATDLHKILLRICFEKPKPEIIQHMVRYNYPMSAHCATIVFDGIFVILEKLQIRSLTVELRRKSQTIFKYFAFSPGQSGLKASIVLALEDNCFYVRAHEKSDNWLSRSHHSNVFDALSNELRPFADAFAMGSDGFVEAVEEAVASAESQSRTWKRTVKWHSNEKLLCPF